MKQLSLFDEKNGGLEWQLDSLMKEFRMEGELEWQRGYLRRLSQEAGGSLKGIRKLYYKEKINEDLYGLGFSSVAGGVFGSLGYLAYKFEGSSNVHRLPLFFALFFGAFGVGSSLVLAYHVLKYATVKE